MKSLKYSLILSVISLIPVAIAADAFDDTVKFETMEKGHKTTWMKFVGDSHKARYDLLSNNVAEWFDLKIKNTTEWKNFSPSQDKNELERKQLEAKIALHESQNQKMHDLHTKKQQEALAIYTKNQKELEAFKVEIGLIKPQETKEGEGK